MIGDIPKGAPRRCRKGRHIGQEQGGTMVFTCPRCGGSFWQPHRDKLRAVEEQAEGMLSRGYGREAVDWAHSEVRRINR